LLILWLGLKIVNDLLNTVVSLVAENEFSAGRAMSLQP
jgi:hypothetical protein